VLIVTMLFVCCSFVSLRIAFIVFCGLNELVCWRFLVLRKVRVSMWLSSEWFVRSGVWVMWVVTMAWVRSMFVREMVRTFF